jgi:arylsulfatase A-like enzyme
VIFAAVTLVAAQVSSKQPNIVFFLVDDMGWQDTSEPFWDEVTDLNKRYRTPNMEKLADQGMKFTQAYACSVCSPTRVSLMTGANAARHRVTTWTLRKDEGPDRRHPRVILPDWNVNGLSQKAGVPRTYVAITLPELLQKVGYRTIHVGKAHYAAHGIPSEDPCELGFDVNISGHCAGGPGSHYGKNNFSAKFRNGDPIWDVPGLEAYHGKDIYLSEALTIEANKQMARAVEDGKPFYLYMSHYAVHAPWEADPRFADKYKGLPERHAAYASMIEGMDKSLGDIMAKIDALGIKDNTVLVFMSDNGCPKQLPRNRPLRGHKITPYEGGVRVPLIVRWPGVTKPDAVCSSDYVIIEDIFPTFLEMAGAPAYKPESGAIDGKSFVPLLKGETGLSKDRPIFWHYPHVYDFRPVSSVRLNDWKLIYHELYGKFELYNLAEDIGEENNLADSQPEKLQALASILGDFLRNSGANMPTNRKTGVEFPYPDDFLANRGDQK